MRVAVWHNVPGGGAKRALYQHVRGLLARGHQVEAWCPSTADEGYLPLADLVPTHVLPLDMSTRDARTRWAYLSQDYRNVSHRIQAMDAHARQVGRAIEAGGFDLFFANTCMHFGASAVGKYVRGPKILYLNEPHRRLYEADPELPWLALPYPDHGWRSVKFWKLFARDLVRIQSLRRHAREEYANACAYDEILVNSFFSRESVMRSYGLPSRVCYLGVDAELFRDLGLAREPMVVGLGTIAGAKGLHLAVRAVAAIHADRRPTLVWIGHLVDRVYVAEVERLARALDVRFVPRMAVGDDELVDTLSRATAMIYTSRLEPFGFAPLEANACGTPVVAIAEGGVRETIRDGVNGVLVPDHSPETLGAALEELLAAPALARRLGAEGRHEVEKHWTWDSAVARLEERFQAVARNAGRR